MYLTPAQTTFTRWKFIVGMKRKIIHQKTDMIIWLTQYNMPSYHIRVKFIERRENKK